MRLKDLTGDTTILEATPLLIRHSLKISMILTGIGV